MSTETQELETVETSNGAAPGGEETNAGSGETSGKETATGNFLTDLLNTEETTDDEEEGAAGDSAGDQGADDGQGEEGDDETEPDVEIVTAGKEIAAGDVVKANGKLLINGEIELEDGRRVKTDGEGKITEISEGTGGEGAAVEGTLELKAGDDVEKFDLSKKEDLEKVREYAQKGRFFEKEMQGFKQEKQTFTAEVEQHQTREQALAYNVLYLQANGKLDSSEFEELPYEDFVGASEKRDSNGEVIEEATKEGDRKLYNAHKKRVTENVKTLTDYQAAFKETAAGFNKMVTEFSAKHPEIKDVKAWINEKLGKYSAPILTYGKEKYPEDLLEMVHHWENRAEIEKKIREDERRKKAKVKIVKDKGVKGQESTGRTGADDFIDDGIFSKYKRKIVN